MRKLLIAAVLLIALLVFAPSAFSQETAAATPAAAATTPEKPAPVFKSGAKVFVEPMEDGFDTFLKEAIEKKKVPLTLVSKKEEADFVLRGTSETQKASAAKKVLMWDWRSNEQASIQVANLVSGEIAFAYSVNKQSSTHGKRSTAEACAKHIKEKLEEAK